MRALGRWIAAGTLVLGIGLACQLDGTTIVQLAGGADTISFTRSGDSIVATVDTTFNATGDTVVVTRFDTIFSPPDTVLVTRFDTVVSGVDTLITTVVDTLVQIDTVIFTTIDTIVVVDTVFVRDTIVIPSSTLAFNVSTLTVNVGASATVNVTLFNYLGLPVPAGTVSWFSNNPSIASVTSGTVLGVAPGSTTVFAVASGASASLSVQVVSPPSPPGGGGGSLLNAHRPGALTTRLSDNFDRGLSAGSSDAAITTWASAGGWSDNGSWVNANIKSVTDATGPNGFTGKRNLWTTAPAGSSPGGALSLVKSLGTSKSQIYIYVSFKFESGYSHATNSEKFIYFDNSPQNIIFEYFDGHHAFYNIDDPTNRYPGDSGGFLRANQEPLGKGANFPNAPPPAAGVWQQIEFYMDSDANTVQWWVDNVLYASYTGVTDFNPISEIMLDDTWGGSGTKPNATSGRIIEYFLIATN